MGILFLTAGSIGATEYNEVKFSISVWPGFSTAASTETNKVLTHASFNIFGGRYDRLEGLEIGGILNLQNDGMTGAQWSGVVNDVGGSALGAQWAGLLNHTKGDFTGAQWAGLINSTEDNFKGAQWAGLSNGAGGNFEGAQWAGLINMTKGESEALQMAGAFNLNQGGFQGAQLAGIVNLDQMDFTGLQMAGIANLNQGGFQGAQLAGISSLVREDYTGLQMAGIVNLNHGGSQGAQFAGIANLVHEDFTGLQMAGIVNVAGKVNGIQVGLVNIADEFDGLPVGLVSYVKDVGFKYDIWFSETGSPSVGLRSGGHKVYNLLSFALNPFSDEKLYMPGIGLGYTFVDNDKYSLSVDALHYSVLESEFEFDEISQLSKLRLIAGKGVGERFTLYGGVTWNVYSSSKNDGEEIAPWSVYDKKSGSTRVRMWHGFLIGVRF